MKLKLFQFRQILMLCLFIALIGCETLEDDSNTDGIGNSDSGISPYGNWVRDNGSAYVKFSSSTATSCANGVITTGTFNASEPSMTFNIQGDIIKFPLKFNSDNTLLVGVPDQAINTNNATLYYRSDKFCDEDGGGSGEGKATFWISSDFNCGPITVSLNGQSGSITSYYYNGTPDCGESGCANFNLSPGTYNFSASCSGYTWSGTINVTEGGCSRMQLTN